MTSSPALERVLGLLRGVERSGTGWTARCPAHEDQHASLSVAEGQDGRVLVNCFAGCPFERIAAAVGLEAGDFFPPRSRNGRIGPGGGGSPIPPKGGATAQPQASGGCTLVAYAEAKRLPCDVLRRFGLSQISYLGQPAVRIPYLDETGAEVAVQFRLALQRGDAGDDRFRFKSGARPTLYGLWRLMEAREAGRVVLVEGASDCHTLWFHGLPAVGVPGAGVWREEWATHLDGIERIDVLLEPDTGGEAIAAWLASSRLRDRAWLVRPDGFKDPSELHVRDPLGFPARWAEILAGAEKWTERAAAEASERHRVAWATCRDLANTPRILDRFGEEVARCGMAGEDRAAKLVYLIIMSRFEPRPVSAGIKGPSAAGKSYLLERVTRFFPPHAYYELSAMSERALAYSEEPLAHRFLILYEAAGLQGDFASYLVRSLLSEGRVRYETVEKTAEGLKPRLIEREGPTGLLVTTTAVHLHPENETRQLSIPVTDTREQTQNVLLALAEEVDQPVDLVPWLGLQVWLEGAEHHVTIPYARALAERIPPVAVRLRRDFGAVLSLVRAHALLHQARRRKDAAGRVVAELDDYRAVRELVADLVAEGVEATVPSTVRETVEAVRVLTPNEKEATVAQVALRLKIDRATALRRVRVAQDRGYVKNLEDKRGRPARLVMGDPLPEEAEILPDPSTLQAPGGCTVAVRSGGIEHPLPPSPEPEAEPWDATEAGRLVDAGLDAWTAAGAPPRGQEPWLSLMRAVDDTWDGEDLVALRAASARLVEQSRAEQEAEALARAAVGSS